MDGLAAPEDVAAVVSAAARFLESRGVDLIISDQSHEACGAALRREGFFPGPSNYVIGVSPKTAGLAAPFEERVRQAHINRGDGDGPIHL